MSRKKESARILTECESIREAYGQTLVELGSENLDIVVLETDVGNSSMSVKFGRIYPERYFNLGIAENNMLGAAAGMALCGKIPFANTFAVFATLRAADPLRTLAAYTNLNMKIAGAYGGLSDSYDGATHQSVEDLAITRALPNMTVVVPTDGTQTREAVRAVTEHDGPVFLRLSREALPLIARDNQPFVLGRGNQLRYGRDITLVACGYMVHKALQAADMLEAEGVQATVIEMPTIKPLDTEILVRSAQETGRVITIEEHSIYGGLGSAVSEFLIQQHWESPLSMRIMGIPDQFGQSGSYEELLTFYGLDANSIVQKARELCVLRGEK